MRSLCPLANSRACIPNSSAANETTSFSNSGDLATSCVELSCCGDFGVSFHTVRNQLVRIFEASKGPAGEALLREVLAKNPDPTEAQIRTAMNGHLCRCGTYPRIRKAVHRAAELMRAAPAGPKGGI